MLISRHCEEFCDVSLLIAPFLVEKLEAIAVVGQMGSSDHYSGIILIACVCMLAQRSCSTVHLSSAKYKELLNVFSLELPSVVRHLRPLQMRDRCCGAMMPTEAAHNLQGHMAK